MGYYTISAPGSIRSNSEYNVAVSIHENAKTCNIKVGIAGSKYNTFKTVEVQPHSSKLVKFNLPSLVKDSYNLTVEGLSGIIFQKQSKLNFNEKEYTVLIQTDKATYKPGDLVKYRVLVLDSNTRPVHIKRDIDISIQDGKQNKIKLMKKVTFTKGVFSGDLQLSTLPVLGDWKIVTEVNGKKHLKDFEVAEYVLPKFEVIVETADWAFQKVHAKIIAKYTYGKPVAGNATISVYEHDKVLESSLLIRKVLPLNGEVRIELNINDGSQLMRLVYGNHILIHAIVEEQLTGLKQIGTATVNIQKNMYKMNAIKMPSICVPGEQFEVKIKITTHDGKPVRDTINPVTARIFITFAEIMTDVVAYLNEEGIATFKFQLPVFDRIVSSPFAYSKSLGKDKTINLKATYRDLEQNFVGLKLYEDKDSNDIRLEILTEEPTINDYVSVSVTSREEFKYLMYQVIGRGDILLSEILQFEDTKQHIFKFSTSFSMAPTARLLVSTIRDGRIYFDEKEIDFGESLSNYIKIQVPAQAEPGDNIPLTVSTNPNSYVGLLGVDQSVLVLKSGNDLTPSRVFDELRQYDNSVTIKNYSYMRERGRVPGSDFGLVTLTNAFYPYTKEYPAEARFTFYEQQQQQQQQQQSFAGPCPSVYNSISNMYTPPVPRALDPIKPKTRTVFHESWIWDSFHIENEGQAILQKKVPDSITSWIITGFSLHPETGLGLTETPGKLKVYQPFFVSTDLPYSVKRGEVVAIPIVVFNYLDQNLEAEVTLDNAAQEFEFVEANNENVQNSAIELNRTKHATVPSNTGQAVSFMIRPNKAGHIKIKVKATTPIAGDAMERMLLVEAEGVTEYINKASLIDLREHSTQAENFKIEIPENVVPDSTHIEVSVVGDILGPTVDNLDQLVRLPCGCGEQNMVNFVPNILILKYLKSINKLNPVIESKAKKYLEVGYQRELTYKHPDGSYSAFGVSDKRGSTWLTAYVARSFRQAAEYIHIEEHIIKSALQFLAKNQANNGSFPEVGVVVDKHHSSGSDKSVALTAFTLLAFIENDKHIPEFRDIINKALNFISSNTDASSDLYSLAISAYALQLADHSTKTMILEALQNRATNEAGKKYWNIFLPSTDKKSAWSFKPRNVNVEVTSYAFLAMVEAGQLNNLLPVFKWLVSQRNANGGFESTQDTVVGLQALTKAGEKLSAKERNVDVVFNFDDCSKACMTINNENSGVHQSHEIPAATKGISVSASGHGVALVQLSYKYNVNVTGQFPRFNINPQLISLSTPDHIYLNVYTSFIPQDEDTGKSSNMAVMEINLPSGFTVDSKNLSYLKEIDRVKKVETKNGETAVFIYFDNLDTTEVCPKIEAFKTHKVSEQKPAAIIVYDYYDNSRQAREFYSAPTADLFDTCEGRY